MISKNLQVVSLNNWAPHIPLFEVTQDHQNWNRSIWIWAKKNWRTTGLPGQRNTWYIIAPLTIMDSGALHNLGSDSWLVLTVVRRASEWLPIARANGQLDPQCAANRHTTPQSATLGFHSVIHIPNYMDHYSFTDPWGMDGWVGHVGWPIADGLTTKWSPIQLAVWRRIAKVNLLIS